MEKNASAVKEGIKKNFFTLCLLAFSGSIIYGLPYFKNYYYNAYVDVYHLTNVQMGVLGSAFGVLGVVSYLVGGILADKFPAKKLIVLSLFATGIGGFAHLFFTSFEALVCIYALWGFTSLLTFWPALMKVVRMQGKEDEQSRAYGIFEGGRGVTNAASMAIATAIFGFFQAKAMPALGLNWIIIFYSVCPILCGILFIFILKEPEKAPGEKAETIKLKDVIRVLKMPAIWLVVLITFCSYSFNMSIYYFNPFATDIVGATVIFGSVLTVLSQYCRPLASPGGGYLADKYGKAPVMFVGFVVMGIGTAVMLMVPGMSSGIQNAVMIVTCIFVYTAMFSNFGIYFSLISEGGIPIEVSGVAIGVVSTLGYLPEVVCPLIAGKTLDVYEGVKGYNIYFTGLIFVALLGCIFCLIWTKKYGKNAKKKLVEAETAPQENTQAIENN